MDTVVKLVELILNNGYKWVSEARAALQLNGLSYVHIGKETLRAQFQRKGKSQYHINCNFVFDDEGVKRSVIQHCPGLVGDIVMTSVLGKMLLGARLER